MKKFLTLTAIFLSLMFAMSAEAVSSFDTRVYQSRLDKFDTLRVYNVEGEESVPYVSVQEYLKLLYGDSVSFNLNENFLTATRNNANVEFNLKNSSLHSEQWDIFSALTEIAPYRTEFCCPKNLTQSPFQKRILPQKLRRKV